MSLKLHPKYFFICLFSIVTCICYSQNKSLELINSLSLLSNNLDSDTCDYVNLNKPSFDGQIVLKDSTILIGELILNQTYKNKLITILNTDNDPKLIDNNTIKEVILLNSNNSKEPTTKFFKINDDNKLYRLVYTNKNQLYVYDSSNKPFDNSLEGRVFIEENNILTDTWNFWSPGAKKDIINYLNKRDGTNYKRREFKSLDALFSKL
jgi:hypothetical protein